MHEAALQRGYVTGHTGFLGSRILQALRADGPATLHESFLNDEPRLELTRPAVVEAALSDLRPGYIVHTAAISSLAACESDPDLAAVVNVDATRAVARAAARCGARLIYLSTDQVFDGKAESYDECAEPSPLHVYGRSKRDGERAVLEEHDDAVVLRLPLIFGRSPSGSRSASEMIIRAVAEGRSLQLFRDEWRRPAAAGWVARRTLALLRSKQRGIRHLVGPRTLSRFEFGVSVCKALGLHEGLIHAASLADQSAAIHRPPRLVLESRHMDEFESDIHPPLTTSLRSEHPDIHPSSR